MAFEDHNEEQFAEPRQPNSRVEGQNRPRTWDFHSNLMGGEVARGSGGEYLTKFVKVLEEICPQIAPGLSVKIIPIGRNQYPNLAFSAVVVAASFTQADPKKLPPAVAYHTLILEATGEELKPVNLRLGNEYVQYHRSTGMAFDHQLRGYCHNAVASIYRGVEDLLQYNAEVVTRDVSVQDREKIEEIMLNCCIAVASGLRLQSGDFPVLDLSSLDPSHDYSQQITLGRHELRDIYGRPNRANVMVTFSSRKRGGRESRDLSAVNSADSVVNIADIGGFVQPIWMPENTNPYSYRQQDRQTQCLAAELVITSVNMPHVTSPAAICLAISNSVALAQNGNWMATLLHNPPRPGVPEDQDLTNVGALNVVANLSGETSEGIFGKPVRMKEARTNLEKMHSWLTAIFHEGLVVSLDVPEQSPSSWYLDVFAAAANDDPDAQAQIIAGFDEITGGNFTRRYDATKSHLFSQSVRLPAGYYMDNGEMVDLRQLDLTAMCVLHHQNPDIIQRYHRCMMASTKEAEALVKLADLHEIYQVSTNHTAVFTGYVERVTFSSEAITAMAAAINDCRLNCVVESPLTSDYRRRGVTVPAFVRGSLAKVDRGFESSRYNDQRYGSRRSW